MATRINIIAAVDPDGIIGVNGKLPWHSPVDINRFKALTWGKTIIIGHNTFLSLPEKLRPLPNRTNIVLKSAKEGIYSSLEDPNLYTASDLTTALHWCAITGQEEVFLIGGRRVFSEGLQVAERLYISDMLEPVKLNHGDVPVYWPVEDTLQATWGLAHTEMCADHVFHILDRIK